MKQFFIVIAAVLSTSLALPAQAAERLNDKQVKALVENIDRGFETWKDALAKRNMDDAVIKSAAGTVDVKKFLKDFKDEIGLMKDRVKPDYAANPEVTTVLRRASDVERRAQQPGQNPVAEWKALSAQLAALAAAYGTAFPVPSADSNAMRLADKEVAARLLEMEQQSKTVAAEADKSMKQAKAPATDRDKVKQAFSGLASSLKQTRSMVGAGTATGAQAATLMATAKAAAGSVGAVSLSGPGKTALASLEANGSVVSKAFGLP